MAIIGNGKRYIEHKYALEKDFEDDVVNSSKTLFGKNTIYINAKKKIEAKFLGGTIPDGFFFDFSDPTDPQFYLVEVELSQHRFYEHIFPQITKFFAFYKNTKLQKTLVDKLFSLINTDEPLRAEFKKFLGQTEIYKFLSDIIESSQNILLITDGVISELPEIMETYADTWGKMVMYLEVIKFVNSIDTIYSVTPDFETLQYTEKGSDEVDDEKEEQEKQKYSEEYHLEGVSQISKDIYFGIKEIVSRYDNNLLFNPQKYYISIKAKKNIAFIKIRNKKVRIIVMMPENEIKEYVHTYPVASLSVPVQEFYNGPCAAINIINLDNIAEIENLIKCLIDKNK